MPMASPRPCSAACAVLVYGGGQCPAHRLQYEQQRGSPDQRGYDAAWRVIRLHALRRDGWQCVQCAWQPDIVINCQVHGLELPERAVLAELSERRRRNMTHLQVDHIRTVEAQPQLRLDLDNLRTLCSRCHSARTMRDRAD